MSKKSKNGEKVKASKKSEKCRKMASNVKKCRKS